MDPDGRQSWDDFVKGMQNGTLSAHYGEHNFPIDANWAEQAGYAVGAGIVRSGQSHGGVRIPAMRMQRPPVKASDRVSGVATGIGRAADREALRNAGVPTSQSRADVKGPEGSPVPKPDRQQMTRDSRGNPVVVSRHQPHPDGNKPHDSSPHSHAATPKIEGGEIQKHKDGTVRYHN